MASDALLKRAYRPKWSFSRDIVTLSDLLNKSGTLLYQKSIPMTLSKSPPTIYKDSCLQSEDSDYTVVTFQHGVNLMFLNVRLLTGVFFLCNWRYVSLKQYCDVRRCRRRRRRL